MTRTCATCGGARADGARFCAQCGAPFDGASPLAAARSNRLAAVGVAAAIAGGAIGVAVVTRGPAVETLVVPSASAAPLSSLLPSPAPVDITFDPIDPTAAPTLAGERIALLGERVAIQGEGGVRLGWVRLTEAVTYTTLRGLDAPSRWMWVGARVEYTADAGLGYADLDWVAHDQQGNRYEPTAFSRDPVLGLGTLEPGATTSGWIAFEVPREVDHLWAAFVNLDGGVVFGVRLF